MQKLRLTTEHQKFKKNIKFLNSASQINYIPLQSSSESFRIQTRRANKTSN